MTSFQITRSADHLQLSGELGIAEAPAIWKTMSTLAAPPAARLDLDLRSTTRIDGAIMALLVELRAALVSRGVPCELVNAPARVAPLVHLYGGDLPPATGRTTTRPGVVSRIGSATIDAGKRLRQLVVFAGELATALGRAIAKPRGANLRELPALIARAGTDGTPIVLVLNFLVGFVMAYQSTRQLELYGASIYVADIVGISLTRELVPLMTAIIVAGRSGAGFAAELGTMRVSEEVDALRTMGFEPTSYLVVPRVVTLVIVTPLLTLLGDVVGIVGGMTVAVSSLDLTSASYFQELRLAVVTSDVWTGLIKSSAFGFAIALLGCQQGLGARGAAAGVGRGTTTTVVYCLFAIVVLDTLFTMLFRMVGL